MTSLTLLLSTQVPFPNKISCFVSTCVSSDSSFPSVRQEPRKRSPFLQQTHGLDPFRLLRSWAFLGKNTGVGCHFLLQEIFATQELNSHLSLQLWQVDSLPLSHLGNPDNSYTMVLFKVLEYSCSYKFEQRYLNAVCRVFNTKKCAEYDTKWKNRGQNVVYTI